MKKRSILWGIFLVISLLIMLINKCAKAESWVIPNPSPIPTLEPLPSFAMPTVTPVAEETPLPSLGTAEPLPTAAPIERSVSAPDELQPTTIYTRQYRTIYYRNQINGTGYNYYLFNEGGSASLPGDLRNFAKRTSGGSVVENEDWEPEHDFSTYRAINGYIGANESNNIPVYNGSFVWAFADYPSSAITNSEFYITYSLDWDYVRLWLNYPSTTEQMFADAGITFDTLLKSWVSLLYTAYDTYGDPIPSSYFEVSTSFENMGDGSGGPYGSPRFRLSDIHASNPLTIVFTFDLPASINLAEIDFMLVVPYLGQNELLFWEQSLFAGQNYIPTTTADYGNWTLAQEGLNISRVVRIPPDRYNLGDLLSGIGGFFSGLFDSFFIPDSEDIQSILLSGLENMNDSEGSLFIKQLRNTIFSLFTMEPPHAVIHIPDIVIKLSANAHHGEQLFTATDYDITKLFEDSPELSQIQSYARLANSYLVTCAFVSSLFYFVCAVFDLHIWKGVEEK